ncbi:MAG TPA: PAS domain S-box protein [Flavisolibacter sp.]|jgi:PAS domain S-box-containing protein|nr:PAS domain S-box protein [Flavisolibacter sp.]
MKRETVTVQEGTHQNVHHKKEDSPLQSLLDSSLDVFCSFDAEGRFVHVSAAAKKVWGYDPQELVGRTYLDFVLAEDHAKSIAASYTIKSGVDVTSFENRYIRKDGRVVPLLWSARWCASENIMYCVAKDATQIKKAEEQNRLLHSRLSSAYKLAEIAWWEYDVATQTFTSSDEIFTIFGLPIPQNNQNTLEEFLSLVHPDDRARLQRDLSCLCQETYINYEHRIVKPSGKVIYVVHYFEVIRDDKGHPVSIHGTAKDITKQKMQQLELEASEKKLQQYSQRLTEILESIGDGFLTVDKEWTVTYWNRKAEELLGKKREEILGKNLWHEYNDAVPLKFYAELQIAMKESISVQFEEYYPSLNMWIEVAAYPSAETLAIYFKDSTIRKMQEAAVQLANERFELVAKATSDVLWDWDVLTNTFYFSDAFTLFFGYENRADLVYKNWIDNIHEEDIKEVVDSLDDALNNTLVTQWASEYRFYRKDKSVAYVLDRGYIIRDGEGKAVRVVGSIQDITKLRETEQQNETLSLVAKETVNAVVITDAEDRITWVNKAFTDITEYSFEEALGKNPGELLQGRNTNQQTKAYLHKCVEERLPFHCEIINYTKSGREYWMEIKGQPLFNESGELVQFFAIQTDITDRKKAEADTLLSEEKYRRLFYESPQPKWMFNAETYKVVDVNEAACALYGYTKDEFLRLRIQDLKRAEDEQELVTSVQMLKEDMNGHYQKIVPHKKKNGEIFYIEITSSPIELPSGVHFFVTGTDMSEKLYLQQQVISEKVAAQKQVARAIIHAQETERSEIGKELHDNVCQLLTTAKLYFENTRHMPEQQETFTAKGIDLLMQSINEIRYLSRQLVSPLSSELDFASSINEVLNHYRSMNLFEVRFTYAATIELVEKDLKTSIIRILQEQLNNTVKYAKASVVEVCISNTEEALQLWYRDNGIGFDPNQVKKGIGLKNIQNRASAYRGTVNLTTEIGMGCQMEVSFPLTEQRETMSLQDQLHS